ncbi:uncharacterized protein CXorf49 homolog [Equus asinus]|uniref:uncharacterized protein CXorf49 homolog n=1 Tax=Equus asinus TaxID=9793 RepID=UPI0038F657EE
MSSPDEESVLGTGFDPEGGERAVVCSAEPRALRTADLGPALGAPRSGEGEGRFLEPEGLESERHVMDSGGQVLRSRQGGPSFPADDRGAAVDSASSRAPRSAVNIVQQLTERGVWGVWRYRYPESCAARGSTVGAGPEAGAGFRGAPAPSWVASQPSSTAPLHFRGPEGSRAWGNPERGGRSRMGGPVGHGQPSAGGPVELPSDPESSDEAREIQLTRMSFYLKEGGQAKSSGPEDPGDPPRRFSFPTRENLPHVPGSFLSSAAQAFTLAAERQTVGELDFSSSQKVECVFWRKMGNRPSYQAAAAAATASVLSRATPWKKAALGKKCLGAASQVAQGRTFPSWGQRGSAAPPDPATFPPLCGVPLLVRRKKYPLAPAGTKQSKQPGTGEKSVAGRTMESQPVEVAGEDIDPNSDPAPQGQPLAHRPEPCSPCMHREEGSSGDLNTRAAPQVPGNPQSLAPSQGNTVPREPAPSGDQEPLDRPPRPEGQQQPPGAEGCPRVLFLWFLEMQAQTRRWGRCTGSTDIRVALPPPSCTPQRERTSFPRGAPASLATGVLEVGARGEGRLRREEAS